MPRIIDHPVQRFDAAALEAARNVRILFLDVDGVLTDGGLIFNAEGEYAKRFHTLDGHGIKLAQRAGITVAVISGRDSNALRTRLAQLGITHFALGTEDKVPAAQRILDTVGLDWAAAAVMGDDWPDLSLFQRCHFAAAPAGAHLENRARAHWVSTAAAGAGAVREVCDLLLSAQGHYGSMLAAYLNPSPAP